MQIASSFVYDSLAIKNMSIIYPMIKKAFTLWSKWNYKEEYSQKDK